MLVFHKAAAARLWFAVLVTSLSGLCSAQEPTAEEITQRLLDWQHSFATLRIVYEVRNPKQWLVRKPELAKSGNIDQYFQRYEWIYSDAGKLSHEYAEYQTGVRISKLHFGTNGRVSFRAEYGEGSFPDTLSVGRSQPFTEFRPMLEIPLSQLHAGHGEWIGDVFTRATPIVLRAGIIDNAHCVAIHRSSRSRYTLWLDLDHDCLPRLNDPDEGINGTRFHVDEFLKLSNGRWFPAKGTEVWTNENQPYHWVVTEAEVNIQLPDSVFAPPKPGPTTRVADSIGYFGNISTSKVLPQNTKDRPANPPPPLPTGSPVTATIPHWNWIWLGLAAVVLVALLLLWNLWRTHC